MINIGKYLSAAKGGPNMASRGPAIANAEEAMSRVMAKRSRGGGSMAGYMGARSTPIQMIGSNYDNPAVHKNSRLAAILKATGPYSPPAVVRPPTVSDFRRLKFHGVTKDNQLRSLL